MASKEENCFFFTFPKWFQSASSRLVIPKVCRLWLKAALCLRRPAPFVLWSPVRRGCHWRGRLLQVEVEQRPSWAERQSCGPEISHGFLHLAHRLKRFLPSPHFWWNDFSLVSAIQTLCQTTTWTWMTFSTQQFALTFPFFPIYKAFSGHSIYLQYMLYKKKQKKKLLRQFPASKNILCTKKRKRKKDIAGGIDANKFGVKLPLFNH